MTVYVTLRLKPLIKRKTIHFKYDLLPCNIFKNNILSPLENVLSDNDKDQSVSAVEGAECSFFYYYYCTVHFDICRVH